MLGKKPPKKRKIKKQYDGYLFSFPIVFLLGALIVYPMLYGFYISFFNTNLVSKWKFVGLKYYLPCCIIGLLMRRGQPHHPCLRIAAPDWAADAKRLRG